MKNNRTDRLTDAELAEIIGQHTMIDTRSLLAELCRLRAIEAAAKALVDDGGTWVRTSALRAGLGGDGEHGFCGDDPRLPTPAPSLRENLMQLAREFRRNHLGVDAGRIEAWVESFLPADGPPTPEPGQSLICHVDGHFELRDWMKGELVGSWPARKP